MAEFSDPFFVIGGSLRTDTPSYVDRLADTELYDALQLGQFCYVLTARQMGKSSLMARTAVRLRARGVRVTTLDLTANGQNLSVEQWYYGLLCRIGEQFDLEDKLDAYWRSHEKQGPLHRFMEALRQEVLGQFAERVVIFIDESYLVRSLASRTSAAHLAPGWMARLAGQEIYLSRICEIWMKRRCMVLNGATSAASVASRRWTPFRSRVVQSKGFRFRATGE